MEELRLLELGSILFLQSELEKFREYCCRMVKIVFVDNNRVKSIICM